MTATYRDSIAFIDWMLSRAIRAARGDDAIQLAVAPEGRFWLGRLAPEQKVLNSRLGERAERLDPCAAGFRIRLSEYDGRTIACQVRMAAWRQLPDPGDDPDSPRWEKTARIEVSIEMPTPRQLGERVSAGQAGISSEISTSGAPGLSAEVVAEIDIGRNGLELTLTVVNTSPEEVPGIDSNLYEVELQASVGDTLPFLLDELPDSFRYDRRIPAYGVNGGVVHSSTDSFITTDLSVFERPRPTFWDGDTLGSAPDLSFSRLAERPIEVLRELSTALRDWTTDMWSTTGLKTRARDESWTDATLNLALEEAAKAEREVSRIEDGVSLVERDKNMCRAFSLANRAFLRANQLETLRHSAWRPFQLGFTVLNLGSLTPEQAQEERASVDTLWFATGGGKTETYLLFALIAAFYDRLRGKSEGVTSWARFPLRMLSLQQTQRFADVIAAAELIRAEEGIDGQAFSVGFLVGEAGTPNRVVKDPRPGMPDYRDPNMPTRYRVLIRCPFCRSEDLRMRFDQARWSLDHLCQQSDCPWNGRPLPFQIVDEEIFRWLPTVVVGTLDKAASIAMQAAMRGLYAAPLGKCPIPNHGFTYAPRSRAPSGCLYPDCNNAPGPLAQAAELFGPTVRMQDELHLLRDSLGAVDSHYEALLDNLQASGGSQAKIIASSATLAGHDHQIEALYRRSGRIFPHQGPHAERSFWSQASDEVARRYVGVAPRGLTLEQANDQLTEALQRAVRQAISDPDIVAQEAGVSPNSLPDLISAYGVDVVYGSTLKDVEAAARSFESQIPIADLNTATLTGRTPLDEVLETLRRLTHPEPNFSDRVHLIAASSMLSHGVDIERLNVMIMLGLPLSTAEFIQTTARVGRSSPGLVIAFHKIARERDAAVFRIFPSFVQHMDRLVDTVPITSKSRRVLELTFPGLEHGRILGIHEPAALAAGLRALTMPARLRTSFVRLGVTEQHELDELVRMLEFTGPLDENLRQDLADHVRYFFRMLNDPAGTARFVPELFDSRPMLSLRDVDQQIPIYSRAGTR